MHTRTEDQEPLTPKQISNRKYYAKKSESIKQKKREQYQAKVNDKPKKPRAEKFISNRAFNKPKKQRLPKKPSDAPTVSDKDKRQCQARRDIENYLTERALGIHDDYESF